MDKFKPTHVHKETGDLFTVIHGDNLYWYVHDSHGERRAFLQDTLTPIQPTEEWEPVPGKDVDTKTNGRLFIKLQWKDAYEWVDFPHPNLRLVDGCRLERRKA